MKMKVGIIGSGIVAQVMGRAFLAEGEEVMMGSRDPLKDSIKKWKAENPGAKAGSFAEAAAFGDLMILAVAGHAALQALEATGLKSLDGKTIIDITNPLSHEPPVNGVLKLSTASNTSLMEKLQHFVPKANFVKAFNTVGNTQMYKPFYKEGRPSMFICGNDPAAKKQVAKILDIFGWETEDMGAVEAARAIEPLCVLWCIPGFLKNQWTHAFKLLK
jgi:predicted dinucleotide-binding enzyme